MQATVAPRNGKSLKEESVVNFGNSDQLGYGAFRLI